MHTCMEQEGVDVQLIYQYDYYVPSLHVYKKCTENSQFMFLFLFLIYWLTGIDRNNIMCRGLDPPSKTPVIVVICLNATFTSKIVHQHTTNSHTAVLVGVSYCLIVRNRTCMGMYASSDPVIYQYDCTTHSCCRSLQELHNRFSGCCFILFGSQEWMEQAYLRGTGVDIPVICQYDFTTFTCKILQEVAVHKQFPHISSSCCCFIILTARSGSTPLILYTTMVVYHLYTMQKFTRSTQQILTQQQFMQKSTRSSSAQQILTHQQFWLVVFRIVFFV
jgi:hypothetical protein